MEIQQIYPKYLMKFMTRKFSQNIKNSKVFSYKLEEGYKHLNFQ